MFAFWVSQPFLRSREFSRGCSITTR